MKKTPSSSPATTTEFQATLRAARDGDADALGKLFERFYPSVEQMVHRSLTYDLRQNRPWLTSRFSTGDVVQEVFRSVLRDLTAFGGSTEDAFRGYLAMVVRNRLIDAIRFHEAARRDGRRAGGPAPIDRLAESQEPPDTSAALGETIETFHRALEQFPERERLLLRARVEQGETFQALADQLGYSSAGVARRAFYASQALLLVRLRESPGTASPK